MTVLAVICPSVPATTSGNTRVPSDIAAADARYNSALTNGKNPLARQTTYVAA
jgi:hypothetical protein